MARRSRHTGRMPANYIAPAIEKNAFTCPRCDTLATQKSADVVVDNQYGEMRATRCSSCNRLAVWEFRATSSSERRFILVYPGKSPAPPPNEDLPDDVKHDYAEAADILNRSPKGAAALLRLAVQRLCKHLGEPGRNINDDIGALVKKGLSPLIQQAMDTVRITGNEAVHPGEINLEDDRELALALFDFVNIIAQELITTPKRVQSIYDRLPEGKRKQVAKRDGGVSTGG